LQLQLLPPPAVGVLVHFHSGVSAGAGPTGHPPGTHPGAEGTVPGGVHGGAVVGFAGFTGAGPIGGAPAMAHSAVAETVITVSSPLAIIETA